MHLGRWSLLVALLAAGLHSHTVITYPGWRGNNLILNATFPYGMQWSYPCGGLTVTTNRTNWPINGGGIAIQPGWFTGHASALIYINIGLGTSGPQAGPPNESFPLLPPFQIDGPTNNPCPGTFCLSQVPMPANISVKVGDLATIQVIETAVHGGALYNCVDIIFTEEADVTPLTEINCYNSSNIMFKDPFSSQSSTTTLLNSTNYFATTSSCPVSTASAICPTKTACPQCNGNSHANEGSGMGLPIAMVALGVLGL